MKCGFGDIIEFQGVRDRDGKETIDEDTYVDRITSICVYDDGSVGYWTQIYPELNGHRAEIKENEILRVLEAKGNFPKVPEFPYHREQYIEFDWDGKTPGSKIRKKAVIEEAHWSMDDMDGEPLMRISAGDAYICFEDEHNIEVLGELRPQRVGAGGKRKDSKPDAREAAGRQDVEAQRSAGSGGDSAVP